MDIKVENLENSEVKLDITIEKERFNKSLDDAFNKNAKYFQVPGFRKGKAPKSVVLNYYNESVLYEEAFNLLVPNVLKEVYKEKNLDVVAPPEIEVSQIGSDKDFIFTAKVVIKPEVKLGKYKGIKLSQKEYKVTDEQIEERLKKVQEQNARIIVAEKDAKLKKGDTAVIDFEGFMDGKPFEGGKAEGHSLVIGSNSFIPGFEDQLIGMQSEEEKEINVTFPEDYMSKDLAGKPATFKVKLHEIKIKELPELDDEFAKDVSEFDTLEEYKEDIKDDIERENELRVKQENEDEAVEKVIESSEMEIPDKMIEAEIDAYIKEFEQRISYQGLKIDQYLAFLNKDMKTFREEYREEAIKHIKQSLVLEAIYKAEDLEVTEDDITAKLTEFAKAYGRDAEEFVKNADEGTRAYVRDQLKFEVAIRFIIANSK